VGCQEPIIVGPCVVTDRTQVWPADAAIFEPIFIQQSAACSMLSRLGLVDIAANRLESTTEWALGRALAMGAESDNISFEDATLIASFDGVGGGNVGLGVVSAISCLEQTAANYGFGAEVFLHAPVAAAAYLANAGVMTEDYMSPAGFQWIISPGYPYVDGTITVWATGSVFASVTPAESLVNGVTGQAPQGWRTNSGAAYAQRLGMAAFDPCLNLSAMFTVPPCGAPG
jgi:hypothetical protein